jgi:glutathione S-transferase
MIKVHHLNRSRSLRILWLLEELGVDYEVIRYERNAKTNLAPPELLTVHPLGKSPVVEIDGQMVSESATIVEVLCALYGPHLIPDAGSPEHWHHLELMHFAEGSVMTPILLNLYVGMLGDAGAPLHPRIQNELTNHFDYMESVLRPSGHFVLDDLSAADIMLSFPASIVGRLGRSSEYPGLTSFAQMIEARPAYVRALEAGGGS